MARRRPHRQQPAPVAGVGVSVTDHAVLRYLERVHGVDVATVRASIAATCERGADAGASSVRLNKVRFVLRGRMVVTTTVRGS